MAASGYFLRSSSGALGRRAPSRAAAAADTVTGRCEVEKGRRAGGGGGSLRFTGCWSSQDEEDEGVLKSRGAGPLSPLTTSASLTMEPSGTAEEGGVRAGRPFPLPLSDDESSEGTQRQGEEEDDQGY